MSSFGVLFVEPQAPYCSVFSRMMSSMHHPQAKPSEIESPIVLLASVVCLVFKKLHVGWFALCYLHA